MKKVLTSRVSCFMIILIKWKETLYVNCKCNGENCKLNIAKARQKQRLESAYLLTAVLLVFRLTFALFDRIFFVLR